MKKKPYNLAGKQSRASGCLCVSVWMCSCVFLSAFMLVANIGGPENEISKGNKCPRTLQRPNDDMRILVIEFFFWVLRREGVLHDRAAPCRQKRARASVAHHAGKSPARMERSRAREPKELYDPATYPLFGEHALRPSVLSAPPWIFPIRPRPSIWPSVRPNLPPSVCLSVAPGPSLSGVVWSEIAYMSKS